MTRERHFHAKQTLAALNIPIGSDFHCLSNTQVDALLAQADLVRYRKPKNANGSRGRYFHNLLQRQAEKRED
jgi:hypothetical protein